MTQLVCHAMPGTLEQACEYISRAGLAPAVVSVVGGNQSWFVVFRVADHEGGSLRLYLGQSPIANPEPFKLQCRVGAV